MKQNGYLIWGVLLYLLSNIAAAQVHLEKTQFPFGTDKMPPGWFPVRLIFKNQGPHTTVTVQATLTSWNINPMRVTKIVTLPQGSRKSVFMYLHNTPNVRRVRIRWEFPEQTRPDVVSQRLDCSSEKYRNILYLGQLSSSRKLHHLARSVRNYRKGGVRVIETDLQQLPNRWYGYDGIDMVVLHETPLYNLSEAQWVALKNWQLQGGMIVILPFSETWLTGLQSRRLLRQLLPYEMPTTIRRQRNMVPAGFPRLPTVTRAISVELKNATKEWRNRHGDLILGRYRRGLGHVFYLALDPGKRGSEIWYNMLKQLPPKRLRNRVLQTNERSYGYSGYYHSWRATRRINRDLTRKLEAKSSRLPSLWAIVILILVYLVMIGPLNFYLLYRRQQRIYLVFTIPLIATLYVGIIFGYGYLSRGVQSRTVKLTIVEPLPNSQQAFVKSYCSLFSASDTNYDIGYDRQTLVQPFYPNSSAVEAQTLTYAFQDRLRLKDFRLRMWQTAYFTIDDFQQFTAPRLKYVAGRYTLENRCAYPLQQAMVVHRNHVWHFGAVAAGAPAVAASRQRFRNIQAVLRQKDNRPVENQLLQLLAQRHRNRPIFIARLATQHFHSHKRIHTGMQPAANLNFLVMNIAE